MRIRIISLFRHHTVPHPHTPYRDLWMASDAMFDPSSPPVRMAATLPGLASTAPYTYYSGYLNAVPLCCRMRCERSIVAPT